VFIVKYQLNMTKEKYDTFNLLKQNFLFDS